MSITKLHASMTKITLALFTAASSLVLSSCQDEDYGFTTQDVRDGVYARNFEKTYGKISEIPTWDFSSYNLSRLKLEGGPSGDTYGSLTRAASGDGECNGAIPGATMGTQSDLIEVASSFYSVEQNTMDWLNEKLTEGEYHKDLGHPFKLVKPDNNKDFLIIPIYQGHSGLSCDLHLVASDNSGNIKDYEIWSKSENLKYTRDYTKAGGEEYFYLTSLENQGGDVPDDSYNGGNIKKLKLGRAYSTLFDKVDDWTTFKVHITIPAGATFKCQFGNVYKSSDGWTETFDNSSGVAPATYEYDLKNILSSTDLKVWPKGDGAMWNFGMKNIECTNCAINTYAPNRVHIAFEINGSVDGYSTQVPITSTNFTEGHTVNRSGIMSKPIRIKCSNIKDVFYLYLDITHGDGDTGNKLANKGARQRSDQGMMLALTEEDLSNGTKLIDDKTALAATLKDYLGESDTDNWEYFVVGCEDANLSNTDNDINDVVFLVAGKKAPKIQEILSKRYMIEDLGSTFDFDFNDIVVDVTRVSHKDVGTGASTIMSTTAKLVHLCGTIPFQIKIGNTVMGSSKNDGKFPGCNTDNCGGTGSGYDPTGDTRYSALMDVDIDGWDPDNNNIVVTTWPTAAGWSDDETTLGYLSSHPGESFTFPENGHFPYIIACDQTVGWMNECYSVPDSWFHTKPSSYDQYQPHSPGGNYTLTINMEDYNDITGFYVNGNKLTFSSDGKATAQVIENTPIKVKIEDNRGEWNARYSYGNGTNDFVERYQEKSIGTMPGYGTSYTFTQKYQVRSFIKNESLLGKNDEYREAGSVTVNGQNVRNDNCNYVEKGAQVTFKATANDGYRFLYWTSGNTTTKIGADGDATLVINDNERTTTFVSAVFEKSDYSLTVNTPSTNDISYTVNYKDGSGAEISDLTKLQPGQNVRISVSASKKDGNNELMTDGDYSFTWSSTTVSGLTTGRATEQEITMPDNSVVINLTLMLKISPKVLKKTANGNNVAWNAGTVTISKDGADITNDPWVAWDTNVTLKASPIDPGFEFDEWLWNSGASAERNLWVGNPAGPTVVFKETTSTYQVAWADKDIDHNTAFTINGDKLVRGLSDTRRTLVFEFSNDPGGFVTLFVPTYANGNQANDGNNKTLQNNVYSTTNINVADGYKVVVVTLTTDEVTKIKANGQMALQHYNGSNTSSKVHLRQVYLKPTPSE